MTILVTGGGGFLGAWVARSLTARGLAVRIFDTGPASAMWQRLAGGEAGDWVIGDITDAGAVDAAMAGCTGAINLAGLLTPACAADPVRGAKVNLLGALHVFEAARRHGIGFVAYASSAGVFGPENGRFPEPNTHYGAFKLACEGSARAYHADHGLSSVGLRPFVVYGPGREVGGSAGPSLACKAAAEGTAFTVPFTGLTGLVYAEDVAEAFAEAVTKRPEGAHVANMQGETVTIADFVARLRARVPGAKIDAAGPPLPVVGRFDGPDAAALFPQVQPTPLERGIDETLAFYRLTS